MIALSNNFNFTLYYKLFQMNQALFPYSFNMYVQTQLHYLFPLVKVIK